jgi:hypothetical protein
LGFSIHASAEYRSQPATTRGSELCYVINSLQERDSFFNRSGKQVARYPLAPNKGGAR